MAEKGENTEERPMWAERGGLDFEGRAKWDAWTALKGMKPERAKLKFVQASHSPHSVQILKHCGACVGLWHASAQRLQRTLSGEAQLPSA